MSSKGFRMRYVLGLLLVCFVVASLMWFSKRISVADMRRILEHRLPKGSSAAEVALVLDSLRISHTEVYRSETAPSALSPGAGSYMNASLQDLRRGNLLADGIFLVFSFDDEGRLVEYSAYYSFTSF